ncbi:hypothetical protein GUJ93_ZPchr0006g40869 [Zizania palustris]|uniref:Uncharacterized protein n=1 Tax=Zizania palustris TaxID=103762 RepID=A0A8J5T6D3_ZIZPA|nr:hypothetical protein GUJ93_ZPchr0006g40869 [Zizania palustris]
MRRDIDTDDNRADDDSCSRQGQWRAKRGGRRRDLYGEGRRWEDGDAGQRMRGTTIGPTTTLAQGEASDRAGGEKKKDVSEEIWTEEGGNRRRVAAIGEGDSGRRKRRDNDPNDNRAADDTCPRRDR